MNSHTFARDTINDITSAQSPRRVELSKQLFERLTSVMNEIHETDFSERFWSILLGSHVNAVISRKELLDEREHNRKPDLYPINGFTFPGKKKKLISNLIRTMKWTMTALNEKKVFSAIEEYDSLLLGFPDSIALRKELSGTPLPYFHPVFPLSGDTAKRDRAYAIADKIKDLFFKNVVKELPQILVEYFSKIYSGIPLYSPEKKTFHVHLYGTILNEFIVAKYVEHSSLFYWYQHGSEYGEFSSYYPHSVSVELADKFRTWGWKIEEKDEPWTAYRLEAFREDYEKYDKNPANELLICYPEFNKKNKPEYIEFSSELFSGLITDRYRKILARPRRSNKLHSHASQLSFISDDRVKVTSGLQPMMKEMAESKLVLQVNVPCTNFLECIYVDHPTIGTLRNDQPTDIVKPYYDFFISNGVLHTDLNSLIDHLNRIEINEWWSDIINSDMYKSFKYKFARSAHTTFTG